MSLGDWIRTTLEERLAPTALSVVDESHQHAGHSGWREGGKLTSVWMWCRRPSRERAGSSATAW